MRIDPDLRTCCFVSNLICATLTIAWVECHANPADETKLFGYLHPQIVQQCDQLVFAEDSLNHDAPDWKAEALVIPIRNREVSKTLLDRNAQERVSRLTDIYQLDHLQAAKLLAAAKVDVAQFFRALDSSATKPVPMLVRAGRFASIPVRREFFYDQSLFARVLATILTPEQHLYRRQRLIELNREWFLRATTEDVLDWFKFQANLSRGQHARLRACLSAAETENGAFIGIDTVLAIDRRSLNSFLRDEQLTIVSQLLDLYGDL